MNLSKKTLLYSIILGVLIVASMFLYLIYLMPNLYVENMKKSDFLKAKSFQEIAMKKDILSKNEVPSVTSSYVLKIPKDGNVVHLNSSMFNSDLEIKNSGVLELIKIIREIDINDKNLDKNPKLKEFSEEKIGEKLMGFLTSNNENFNYRFQLNNKDNKENEPYKETQSADFFKGEDYIMVSSSVKEGNRYYSSYIGIGKKNGETIITMTPFASADIKNIREVAMGSLPMIILYVFLITLLASLYFSSKIVNPIKKLGAYTSNLGNLNYKEAVPIEINTNDEIEVLSGKINSMYEELRLSYKKLEDENKNKELFLRASSHQLKTPIQATLLLLDGMIGEIGKFKDRDKYLVEVKKQIISMQKIIEDLLFLNKPITSDMNVELEANSIIEAVINENRVGLDSKNIIVNKSLKKVTLNTNPIIFKKIIDNLLSNAITHGEENSTIDIILNTNDLEFINDGHIPEEIIDNVFEAFVTTKSHKKSGGLGLFIAERFSRSLGFNISCKNLENNKVSFRVDFI